MVVITTTKDLRVAATTFMMLTLAAAAASSSRRTSSSLLVSRRSLSLAAASSSASFLHRPPLAFTSNHPSLGGERNRLDRRPSHASSDTVVGFHSVRNYHHHSQQGNTMMFQNAPFFFTVAAALLSCHHHPRRTSSSSTSCNTARAMSTDSDSNTADGTPLATSSSSSSTSFDDAPCPFYGCPLYPADIHYNTDSIRDVLQQMRELKAVQVEEKGLLSGNHLPSSSSSSSNSQENSNTANANANDDDDPNYSNRRLQQWNRRDAACLTLIGYKGGSLQQQVNQDRAFVVSPYTVQEESNNDSDSDQQCADDDSERLLLGVFDGHAPRGELVSEYTVQELPIRLAERLKKLPPKRKSTATNSDSTTEEDRKIRRQRTMATVAALNATFVELDNAVPADPSGGCTASVVLRQDHQVYVANAGDSRSMIVTYRPSTGKTNVVYISREDKPSLPDERQRVEAMGGQVYIPVRGTSRVVYQDPRTGAPTGLAMSRSIGDWSAGKLGVIPDPIVQVLDIPELVAAELSSSKSTSLGEHTDTSEMCFMVDEMGEVSNMESCSDDATGSSSAGGYTGEDDVHIFAVSATDGMMDYLTGPEIAEALSKPLFDATEGSHPVTACELLIFRAVNGWQVDKQGRYRDDIAIAVSAIRIPPSSSKADGSSSKTTPPAQ